MDMVCASLAFIDGLGAPEMVLIFVIVLVLFGGQKLPEFARGLGKSIREFKKAAAGVEEEFKRALEDDERKHATPKLTAPVTPDPVDSSHDYSSDYDHTADPAGPEATVHSPVTATEITPPAAGSTEIPQAAPAPLANDPSLASPVTPPAAGNATTSAVNPPPSSPTAPPAAPGIASAPSAPASGIPPAPASPPPPPAGSPPPTP